MPDESLLSVESSAAGTGETNVPRALAPLHLRLFALLFDYAIIVSGVKLVEQILLGEHWDLRPLPVQTGWTAIASPWQGAMLGLLLLRDMPGLSIGKWLTDVTIRRAEDPTRSTALWQRLIRNLSLILLPIDAWLVFRDPYGRRLGERWAGTVVVQRPRPRDLYLRAMGLGVLFLGFVLSALLITSWNLRRSAAFQVSLGAAQTDVSLTQQIGSPLKIDLSPDLELQLPAINDPGGPGQAIATYEANGPGGKAKLRVELMLVSASATEPPHWVVAKTEVQDVRLGKLSQHPAPPSTK
jgi:hypothetical protein